MVWPFRSKPSRALATKSFPVNPASAIYREDFITSLRALSNAPNSDYDRIHAASQHPIIMSCVRRIAWASASVKFGVEAMNGDVFYDHPIAALLDDPRTSGGRWSLIQLVAASLALTGRAYIYAPRSAFPNEPPSMLGFLATHKVERIVDASSQTITGYRYTPPIGTIGMMVLDPQDVIELRHHWLTDHDDVFGKAQASAMVHSQMVPAWGPMKMFSGLSDLIRKLLENNGGLPGILSVSASPETEPMTNEQRAAMRQYFKRFSTGGDSFGEIAFLDTAGAKVDFIRITEDFKTINMEFAKKASVNEICAIFGVPPLILGLGEGATYANQKEARRYFWMDTVIPGYIEPICDALSHHFGMKIVPDLAEIPALSDYRTDLLGSLEGITFLTINEKRAKAGYGAIMGGDIIMVNPMMSPLNRAIDANGNNLSDETDQWVANQEAIRQSIQTGKPIALPANGPPITGPPNGQKAYLRAVPVVKPALSTRQVKTVQPFRRTSIPAAKRH